MTNILYRKNRLTRTGSVFNSSLNRNFAHGSTGIELNPGDAARLPTPGNGAILHLRLGTDALYEIAVCSALSGDALTCYPLERDWPTGTPVTAVISAEMLESFAPYPTLLFGEGPPAVGIGIITGGGSFYFDYLNLLVYGPNVVTLEEGMITESWGSPIASLSPAPA